MSKKTIFASSVVIVVLVLLVCIGVGLFFVFRRKPAQQLDVTSETRLMNSQKNMEPTSVDTNPECVEYETD